MARYRVGEGGVRVISGRGTYSLPPGTVLEEIPHQYEGKLETIEWDEPKRVDGYQTAVIRPAEDKSL